MRSSSTSSASSSIVWTARLRDLRATGHRRLARLHLRPNPRPVLFDWFVRWPGLSHGKPVGGSGWPLFIKYSSTCCASWTLCRSRWFQEKMHASVTAACEEAGTDPLEATSGKYSPEEENETLTGGGLWRRTPEQEADAQAKLSLRFAMQQTFQGRYSWYLLSARDWLRGRRIRPHCSAGLNSRCSSSSGPIAAAILGSWAIACDDRVCGWPAAFRSSPWSGWCYRLETWRRWSRSFRRTRSPQVVDQPS